jgi:hypothetical protein
MPHPRSSTVHRIKKLKSGQCPTKGCNAIIITIIIMTIIIQANI